MKEHKVISLTVLVMFISSPMYARTFYVATTGNDSNEGSMNQPWRTLSKAVSVARGNDTVLVRDGNFAESEILIRQDEGMGGSDGKYLTISAYPGEKPIFSNGNRPMIIDANYVRVQELEFRDGKEMSVSAWHGPRHHVELLDNRFSGAGGYAPIEATGDNLLIQGNIIELTGNTVGTQGHGIYLSQGSNNVIRGNRISGMTGYGIHIFDQRRSEDGPTTERLLSNLLVEGNTVFHSLERAGIIVSAYDHAKVQGVVIRNNILYDHPGSGIVIRDDVSDVKIYNNTIYNINTDNIDWNGAEGIYIGTSGSGPTPKNILLKNNIIVTVNPQSSHVMQETSTNVSADHNLYWPLPVVLVNVTDTKPSTADPRFINPAGADFHLQVGSPAINAGIDVGIPFVGSAPDIGAIEYDSGLAVEFSSFVAQCTDGIVRLIWTSSETDNFGFEIERSSDDINFAKIGSVSGSETITSQHIYQFDDLLAEPAQKYYYRLKQIDRDGSFTYTGSVMVQVAGPDRFLLKQNYPNPFNSSTEIAFTLPYRTHIALTIYDMTGQEIIGLIDGDQERGMHRVKWDGNTKQGYSVGGGLYICVLRTGMSTITRKLILLH